jgi:hypothetical protein
MDTPVKNVTRDEIRKARVAGLYEYLEACHPDGFRYVGTTMLCMKSRDSIYIKKGIPGFTDFSDGSHGNSIDFLTEYLGYPFREAVAALVSSRAPVHVVRICAAPETRQGGIPLRTIVLPEPADKPYRRMYAYLGSRGFPADLIRHMESSGLAYQESLHGNIVFASPERDYCEIRGTCTYADRPFHGCMKTRPDRFWYLINCRTQEKPETAYICEAAIDAASLLLLHKYDGITGPAAYISIGGAANQQSINRIKTRIRSVLAVDNDEAGQKCRDRNHELESIIPFCKDWNDDLRQRKTVSFPGAPGHGKISF